MALEKIDLTCPKCGGNMEPDADNKRLHCPYCGHEVIIKNDDAKSLEEKAYARQRGILHANEEAERKKKIKKMRRTLIIVGVVLAFIAAAIIYGASQPKVDPFRYITVSFSGTSGSGEAEIIVQPEPDGDVDPQSISYSLDKHYFLFEGDTVTVTAYSSEYTLSPLTKTYKVTGLDTYLTDINSISEKAVEMIHNKSDMTADMAVSGPGTSVKVKSLKPCAMFLATDGKKNTLYDIYKAKFKEKNSGYAENHAAEGGNVGQDQNIIDVGCAVIEREECQLIKFCAIEPISRGLCGCCFTHTLTPYLSSWRPCRRYPSAHRRDSEPTPCGRRPRRSTRRRPREP